MKAFINFLIFGVVIGLAILCEDFIARGVGVGVCIAAIIIGYMIGDRTKLRETCGLFLFSSGYVLALLFFILTLVLEVHVYDNGKNVQVRSRFWTHALAEGTRLEVKKIRYAYTSECGFIQGVETEDFRFIYTEKGTCVICSKYARIMEVCLPFRLTERDCGDGKLQFIVDANGHAFDFHGKLVGNNYRPIKVDHGVSDPVP